MKTLDQYTPQQIARLDEIQALLTKYNRRVSENHAEIYNSPSLTKEEIAANSGYRQLLMEREAKQNPITL